MTNEQDQTQTKATILTPQEIRMIIPQCCVEGWPSCIHVPKKQRKVKSNIGL